MSRGFSVWVPIQILFFGVLAVVLSFTAYSRRVKSGDVYNRNGVCLYPGTKAWYSGMAAALNLLFMQITLSDGLKCYRCNGERRYSSKCGAIISIILFIFSWISFVIAIIALICAAVVNNHGYLKNHHGTVMNGKNCFVAEDGLFLGAAIWCIFTTVFALISYGFWACSVANSNNHVSSDVGDGVAMAQSRT